MPSTLENALFSANVYGNLTEVRAARNTLPVPQGWAALQPRVASLDGFMATAYQRGAEIVIAYAGTTDENLLDWLTGNVPAASASTLPVQVLSAAKFYLDVRRENPGAAISFTGHSMGGGLASLMAVYFDRQATVFDQAPFQKSADSATVVNALKLALSAQGYSLPQEFSGYVAIDPTGSFLASPTRLAREGQVRHVFVTGEALSLADTALTNFVSAALGVVNPALWILGTGIDKISGVDVPVDPLAQSMLGWGVRNSETGGFVSGIAGDPVDLHSMTLLAGFLQSPQFLSTVRTHPELLPRIFAGLYESAPRSDSANLLDMLVQREVLGENSLGVLATDVSKVNLNEGLTSVQEVHGVNGAQVPLHVASILADAVLAGLYHQGKDREPAHVGLPQFQAVLRSVAGGVEVDMAALGHEAAAVERELRALLEALIGESVLGVSTSAQARWTLQTGSNPLQSSQFSDDRDDIMLGYTGADALAGGAGDDVLVGYAGNDNLAAGSGYDRLYGGEGADTLSGGSGSDVLVGGGGDDRYEFDDGHGGDVIFDSSGQDTLWFSGQQITGGKKVDDNYWISDDQQFGFTLVPNGSGNDLVISRGSRLDQIRVSNWVAGQMGLTLDEAAAHVPEQRLYFGGDFVKKVHDNDSTRYLFDNNGNYAVDPNGLPGPQPDLITGSAGTDDLFGGAGNDALGGLGGNDLLRGGGGDDFLAGGSGRDDLRGESGNDYLYGSGFLSGTRPATTTEAPPVAGGPELSRGHGWVVYDGGVDSNDVSLSLHAGIGVDSVNADVGNMLDGGPGNDKIRAGLGDDIAYGGTDDDDIKGMAGNDVLFGEDGNDWLDGDGTALVGYTASTPATLHGADVLDGGAGNDVLAGQGGSDVLFGSSGADKLWGDSWDVRDTPLSAHGDDMLDGGMGNDQLVGGAGRDLLIGGADNDTLRGDDDNSRVAGTAHGDDTLHGGDGDDLLQGDGGGDSLYGGAGADSLAGDARVDQVSEQYHGGDYLDAGAGNDVLEAGGGGDIALGGEGDDQIDGDGPSVGGQYHGADNLDGGGGDDLVIGGGSSDSITGADGNDRLLGDDDSEIRLASEWHGTDSLDGGAGNDLIVGGGAADKLAGGDGNDELWGDDGESKLAAQRHGADVLDGGFGDDVLMGGGGNDRLDGGAGNDWLAGENQETLTASSSLQGDDVLSGGAGDDALLGGNGADRLHGDSGNDHLYGGDGNDVLQGGTGVDVLDGGAGDDTYLVDGADSRVIDGFHVLTPDRIRASEGADTVRLVGVNRSDVSVGIVAPSGVSIGNGLNAVVLEGALTGSVQSLHLDDGVVATRRLINEELGVVVDMASVTPGSRLWGGALNDALTAAPQADGSVISAGRGNDVINLQADGGATLLMAAGDGIDTLFAASGRAAGSKNVLDLAPGIQLSDLRLVWNAGGRHLLSIGGSDGVQFDLVAWPNAAAVPAGAWPIDEIRFSDGSVSTMADVVARGVYLLPQATAGDDVVTLTSVSDFFDGLAGNDRVDGAAGNDVLVGGVGDDTLFGAAGHDDLDGGAGRDRLEGGDGSDHYRLSGSGDTAVDSAISDDTYTLASWTAGGFDTISDAGGSDSLVTLGNVSVDSIKVKNTGRDLLIWNSGAYSGNQVTLVGAVGTDGRIDANRMMESLSFASGTVWTAADIVARSLRTTAGDDDVAGYANHEVIDGGAGRDRLDGGAGDDDLRGGSGFDALTGGSGNDVLRAGPDGGQLSGGLGNDRFVVAAGDGAVFISDLMGAPGVDLGTDVLVIDSARSVVTITPTVASRWESTYQPDTLQLSWGGGVASVALDLSGASGTVSSPRGRIEFADGTVSSVTELMRAYLPQGTPQADDMEGSSLDDTMDGGSGDDQLWGKEGDDVLRGGAGNDRIAAGQGNNWINGGTGNDTLSYGSGNNTIAMDLGSGFDTIFSSANSQQDLGTNTVAMGASIAPDQIDVRWTSWHDGTSRPDQLAISIRGTNDVLTFGRGQGDGLVGFYHESSGLVIDRVSFASGVAWDHQVLMQRANAATSGDDILIDEGNVDALEGGSGRDVLLGLRGNDILRGGEGDDYLDGGFGNDRLIGGQGDDTLRGGHDGHTVIEYVVGDGNDSFSLSHGSGLPTSAAIEFGTGINAEHLRGVRPGMIGAGGVDYRATLQLSMGGSVTISDASRRSQLPNLIRFGNGAVIGQDEVASYFLVGTAAADQMMGFRDSGDVLHGGDGNDQLWGLAGSDTLNGGNGDDQLFAVGGSSSPWDGIASTEDSDVLIGGAGNDELYAANGHVQYRFDAGFGRDVIKYSADWRSGAMGTVRFGAGIAATDIAVLQPTGDSLMLRHRSTGDSVLIESFFASGRPVSRVDFADGTAWTYESIISRVEQTATEGPDVINGTPGQDQINSLGGNDQVYGLGGDDVLNGGTGNDALYGGPGNDSLDGGTGTDSLAGGAGDDVYGVDSTADVVTENAGEGVDTVLSSVSLTLAAHVENLTVTGTGALAGTGNDLNNVLVGNSGSNTLSGGAGSDRLDGMGGADTLRGGTGDDTYLVDSTADVVTENAGEGADTVLSAITLTLAANVENLTLTGNSANNGTGNALANVLTGNGAGNTLTGGAGNDRLDGAAGSDSLRGGSGDDTYVIDAAGDVVTENAGEGTDTVLSAVTLTLPVNVENLTLMGTAAVNATGNTQNNVLRGNNSANVLNGGSGADTLIGAGGNDTYNVDNVSDVITELAGEGTDLVVSSVSYVLAANVENLTLTGTSALSGTGNELGNVLDGNGANNILNGGAGNDRLDGLAGVDTLRGGIGDDTYVVDNVGDVVTENVSEGNDSVFSSVALTLATNVENLTLTGTAAINGTGNSAANVLVGNGSGNLLEGGAGNDRLDGGAGTDTHRGGTGNDTYVVDSVTDIVVESINEGYDAVQSGVSWTLGAHVESLTLTGTAATNGTGNELGNYLQGNSAPNILQGGAGDDVLNGAEGHDTLGGGVGNDTIFVHDIGDTVTESPGEGIDTIMLYTNDPNVYWYTLPDNVENLNASGDSLNHYLGGNSSANELTGGAGNDTLNGRGGIDTMKGGAGDDRYFVHESLDVVIEAVGAGTDTVVLYPNDWQFVDYSLPSHVEHADASGHWRGMNIRGNDLSNDLLGSPYADMLDGQGGIDTLRGGAGADRYAFGLGSGVDTIVENDVTLNGADIVQFGAGVLQSQLAFARASNDLEISLAGTSDRLIVKDWYLGEPHQIEEFRFADGSVASASQAQALADAMATFGAPASQGSSGASALVADPLSPRAALWRGADLAVAG